MKIRRRSVPWHCRRRDRCVERLSTKNNLLQRVFRTKLSQNIQYRLDMHVLIIGILCVFWVWPDTWVAVGEKANEVTQLLIIFFARELMRTNFSKHALCVSSGYFITIYFDISQYFHTNDGLIWAPQLDVWGLLTNLNNKFTHWTPFTCLDDDEPLTNEDVGRLLLHGGPAAQSWAICKPPFSNTLNPFSPSIPFNPHFQ